MKRKNRFLSWIADLFAMKSARWGKRKRKDKNGVVVKWEASKASLRNPIAGTDYLVREKTAYLRFSELIDAYECDDESCDI